MAASRKSNIDTNDISIEFNDSDNDSLVSEHVTSDVELLSESEYEEEDGELFVNNEAVWGTNPPQFGVDQLDFTGSSGVNSEIVNIEPLVLFQLIFTDELIELIVNMRNNYARQCMSDPAFKISNRLKNWKEVTVAEMWQMIGFIIYQGLIVKPEYSSYYTSNKIFATPGVKHLLSYNRFVNIDRFLHFVDNETLGENYPKSAKIQPV